MRINTVLAILLLFSTTLASAKIHNMDKTKVKVDIRSEDITPFLKTLQLEHSSMESSQLFFYDTPELDLFKQNLILRGRSGSDNDITAKIRPAQPQTISSDWFEIKGFKCEYDQTVSSKVPCCELKESSNQVGHASVDRLLSDNQKSFLLGSSTSTIDWSRIQSIGPIAVSEWTISPNGNDIAVELWVLPQGYSFLELSEHIRVGEEDAARADLLSVLSQAGVQENKTGENKTEFVMEIYLKNHSK